MSFNSFINQYTVCIPLRDLEKYINSLSKSKVLLPKKSSPVVKSSGKGGNRNKGSGVRSKKNKSKTNKPKIVASKKIVTVNKNQLKQQHKKKVKLLKNPYKVKLPTIAELD